LQHSFWRGRSVFVTGATGLIGARLVQHLQGAGAEVLVLIRHASAGGMLASEGILDRVASVKGCIDLEPVIQNEASSDTREQYMAFEKARAVLGWEPGYSFEAGLRETIAWYMNHLAFSAGRMSVSEEAACCAH